MRDLNGCIPDFSEIVNQRIHKSGLDPMNQNHLYWRKQVAYESGPKNYKLISIGPMDIKNNLPSLDPAWLSLLRQRYTEIAARRVPQDAVEDIVQDALGIVLVKGPAQAHGEGLVDPPLRWSFIVLRNVIGNWYQKRRRHESVEGLELKDDRPDALASLTTAERAQTIRAAVDELRLERPDCAGWLWSMAQGTKAGVLAARARMEQAAFYRKIYRCRKMLAEILLRKGVTP